MSWWSVIFQLLIMLIIAIASYHYLETPLRYAEWSPLRWQTIGYGLATPIVASIGTILVGNWHEVVFLGKFKGEDFTYIQRDMECELLSPKPVKDWKTCLARESNAPHVFILGDSHSSNLVPSLRGAGEQHGFAYIRYLSNALEGRYSSYTSENRDAPQFWNNNLTYQKFSASLKPGDLVVYTHTYAPGDDLGPIKRHVQVLADSVKQARARLILVDDIPKPCDDSEFARSFIISNGKGCGISKSLAILRRQPLTTFLQSQAGGRISYLDPIHSLCEGGYCYPTLYGNILYTDTASHFSVTNPAPLKKLFVKHIGALR